MPNISRPSTPSRPSIGDFNPSGSRPSISRPTLPGGGSGIANRPAIQFPSDLRPATRPSFPSGGIGGGDRPSINFPGGGDFRPGGGDRPSIGNITRPGQGGSGIQRPTPLPEIGGNRPGIGDRPIIGGGNRPDRPIIGDGNIINRPGGIQIGGGIGNNNNININRPGWGIGNRPGDWNHNWGNNWHDHCINPGHGWYHGCWAGHWGAYWYRPVVWGAVGWGLGASYSNPYYDSSYTSYDYSQPVQVYSGYAPADDGSGATQPAPQQSPEEQQAMQSFNDALALFKKGSYQEALTKINSALTVMPKDPVLHEVRALCLFALGQYKEAAATLNSLLASAPGMDWTSMSSLYGNVADYTQQLRNLETHVKNNPTDTAAIFVLAYHYLVIGQNDAAIKMLQIVVEKQPKDATARRMLDALAPPQSAAPAETPLPPPTDAPASDAPTTDLVGRWLAKSSGATVELVITDQSEFVWRATPTGKSAVEVKGQVSATSDSLTLDSKEQGAMVGQVKSGGPDKFTFIMAGSGPSDPGIMFERVK